MGDRPTTAPNARAVRFADELGLEINDDEDETRPSTAPTKKAKNNTLSTEAHSTDAQNTGDMSTTNGRRSSMNVEQGKQKGRLSSFILRIFFY